MYYSTGAEVIATFSDEKIGIYRLSVSPSRLKIVIS